MKTLITFLIIASFIQSTILPLDLVLIILISRSYIRPDRTNLFLAFSFGLFDGYLSLNMLGLVSIIYLVLIQIVRSLSKSRLASNLLMIVPVSFILLFLKGYFSSIFIHQPQLLPKILWESLLSLPIFYLIKVWQERFIVQKEIKLKV